MKIDINKIIGEKRKESKIPFQWLHDELLAKGFIIDKENSEITKLVLQYFLGHEDFIKSKLIKSDPSLEKGLLIYGDYGIGKTFLFESLHNIGRKLITKHGIKDLWFNTISAGSFIEKYMEQVSLPNDIRTMWIEDYYKGRLYIDDLGFEKMAFNKTELLAEIIFERNKKQSVTFVTTNLSPTELNKRYGNRIGDRLFEMFNIIQWKGESRRK